MYFLLVNPLFYMASLYESTIGCHYAFEYHSMELIKSLITKGATFIAPPVSYVLIFQPHLHQYEHLIHYVVMS